MQSFWSQSWKYALYVPAVAGAVIVKVAGNVPAPDRSVVSAQLVKMFDGTEEGVSSQPVPFQVLPMRVPVTTAVIDAPGWTVTELTPFNVTDGIVQLIASTDSALALGLVFALPRER